MQSSIQQSLYLKQSTIEMYGMKSQIQSQYYQQQSGIPIKIQLTLLWDMSHFGDPRTDLSGHAPQL
jgi:hypothetical protein